MIYEILNQLKSKGSVNSEDVIQILNKFKDINSKEQILKCTEQDYVKYVQFGLEAITETVDRNKDGRYQNM